MRENLPGEQWLPVVGYEGLYEVSNRGRVWSVPRWSHDGRRMIGGILLCPAPNSKGYLYVNITRDGKALTLAVHRLVLEAFVGVREPDQECCHGPGGQLDNRWPENIRWDTSARNQGHDKLLTGTTVRGERNGQAKLTAPQVIEIRARFEAGETQTAIASDYGVDGSAISLIINGKNWAWLEPETATTPVPEISGTRGRSDEAA